MSSSSLDRKDDLDVIASNDTDHKKEILYDHDLHPEHSQDFLRDGERWATEEDMKTLKRISDRIPIAAFFVVLTEFCERFTYYGITGPFQNYIQNGYKVTDRPGAIGGGQKMATGLSNFFQFWCYVTPIVGAIVADQWLGKYKTILLFGAIYIVGDIILTCTSIPASILNGGALPGLIIAMITIGLGTGGIKSNVSPMVAEQYGRYRPFVRKLKNGNEVVVDRELTVQSIFNWFYWSINVGGLSAIATTTMEKEIDFWASYLLPTLMFIVCIFAFWLGRKKYVITKPTGSITLKAYRVIKAGIKNYRSAKKSGQLIVPEEEGTKVNWLEYAKPTYNIGGVSMDWDDKFVNELRVAVRACKIFLCYPVFWLCYGQMSNNMVSQSGQMNTGKVPNDIMQNINPLVIIILIPFFDRLIYPGFRRCGLELRPVTRITLGFTFAALGMVYAAIVQHIVYTTGPYYEHPGEENTGFNNITAAIQVPNYVLIAIAEIFASVTGLEYAYSKAPEKMKSIVMSMFLFTNAGGSILAFCFNPISSNPHLVKNFAIAAGLMGAFTILFYFCFRHYDNRDKQEYIKSVEKTMDNDRK